MVQRLWEEIRSWAARAALAVLVALLCWFFAPVWRLWNATGFEMERTAVHLKISNARTASLEALRVLVVGTIASRLTARIESEAMAEVPQDDPLSHKFQKLADGSEAVLGRGSTLELAAHSNFDFRHDVRTLVLIAKDGFSTNLEAMEAVRPLKMLLCVAAGVFAFCLFAPRARRRLWPTSMEKTLKLAEGTPAQKEKFQKAFSRNAREHLESLVVLDTMSSSDVQHVVYDATERMLRDAGSLRGAKGARAASEVNAWVRRHTEAALNKAYADRSARTYPGWILR